MKKLTLTVDPDVIVELKKLKVQIAEQKRVTTMSLNDVVVELIHFYLKEK